MKIFLIGYMGSGKSYIGERLAQRLNFTYKDLDQLIEENEGSSISDLFQNKGEIYFRRKEREALEEVVDDNSNLVISLGGGTPCYGDNMDVIKSNPDSTSFYLKLNIENLTARLEKEKSQRPLISHLKNEEELEEFIRKHLFERSFYYNQSDFIITCDKLSAEEIINKIIEELG